MLQLPIKIHYAALAMMALARRWETRELVTAKVIAEEENIPSQFLLQILQQLRSSGLIASTRGANGGFSLNRQPSQINVAQIVESICPCSNAAESKQESSSAADAALQSLWSELNGKHREVLEQASLARLLEQSADHPAMFYI